MIKIGGENTAFLEVFKMDWNFIDSLVVLTGLFGTICFPIIRLTNAITKLNSTCEGLNQKVTKIETKSAESHARLWNHNNKQDVLLKDYEKRIFILEDWRENHERFN